MRWVLGAILWLSVLLGLVVGACGGGSDSDLYAENGSGGSSGASSGGSGGGLFDGSNGDASSLTIEPVNPTLTVKSGQPVPTQQFVAKSLGAPVTAAWSLDKAEIGSIDANGLFTPSGTVGGPAMVTAKVGTYQASTNVTVIIELDQNGTSQSDPCSTAGGCGGVGGEGAGGPLDPAIIALLEGVTTSAGAPSWLYPYDKTVFPLGILGPLLQWTALGSAGDGVMIKLDSDFFHYKGFFGRPAPLPAGAPFVRHPIPQNVWESATSSSSGTALTVTLVYAAGGVAYGPMNETWSIASSYLKGTVYYQSYGTKLAKNYTGAIGGDGMFGGATLAIKGGSTEPVLVAGSNGDHTQCRVCHSVSADGSKMVVQHGDDYSASSSYALTTAGYPESPYPGSTIGRLGWPGIFPDGSIALSNAGPLSGNANTVDTALYDVATGAAVAANGLAGFVTKAGMPAFSPDGTKVAFQLFEGPGDATTGPGDGSQLVMMSFDKATATFSDPKLLWKAPADQQPGWPTFMPTMDRVIFEVEIGISGEYFATRNGKRGGIWSVDIATGQAGPLEQLNGKLGGVQTIPTGGNNHGDDTTLGYEPTANPIVSGGYSWVVFTSRRLYGNVATIDPHWSDPREHDLTLTPTCKKLWVAAIDLPKGGENPTPAADPSHPAFYLPAQELLAGNTRGFWVPDPCKEDGEECVSGDECCGGYCSWDEALQKFVCNPGQGGCSQEFDKCVVKEDCCDWQITGMNCINGRCARPGPT